MTALKDAFPIPSLYLNQYVWAAMTGIDETLLPLYGDTVPFFPLADSRAGDAGWGNKPYVVYDNLFKLRGRPFPQIKHLQIMYFVRGSAEDVITWSNTIAHILDREDDSAKDVNNYLSVNSSLPPDVFFHRIRVHQIDMVNDQRQDLAVRQQYTATMIIDTKYHITQNSGFD